MEKGSPHLACLSQPVGAKKRERLGHVQPTDALPTGQLSTLKDIAAIVRWAA